jgi:hypothetical protein
MRSIACLLVVLAFVAVQGNNFSFPSSSVWYQDISNMQVDPSSSGVISYLSSQGIWTTTNKYVKRRREEGEEREREKTSYLFPFPLFLPIIAVLMPNRVIFLHLPLSPLSSLSLSLLGWGIP